MYQRAIESHRIQPKRLVESRRLWGAAVYLSSFLLEEQKIIGIEYPQKESRPDFYGQLNETISCVLHFGKKREDKKKKNQEWGK